MTRTLNIVAFLALGAAGGLAAAQTSGQASAQTNATAGVQAGSTTAQANAGASAGANTSAKQGSQQGSLAAGTAMDAELNQPLDSKKCKPGDTVVAHTTSAVKAEGKTVLPKGTKLVGHVTRAAARANGDAESALAVQFDRAVLKNGQEMPLSVTIQALAAAQGVAAVGGDDLEGTGIVGAGGGAAASGGGGRGAAGGVAGAVGAVGGTASSVAGAVPRVAEGAASTVNSTANAAAGTAIRGTAGGLNAAGQLTSTSRGVFGLNGLNLDANASNSTQGSVMTSAGKSVHLDSGTRMLLVAQAETAASAQK